MRGRGRGEVSQSLEVGEQPQRLGPGTHRQLHPDWHLITPLHLRDGRRVAHLVVVLDFARRTSLAVDEEGVGVLQRLLNLLVEDGEAVVDDKVRVLEATAELLLPLPGVGEMAEDLGDGDVEGLPVVIGRFLIHHHLEEGAPFLVVRGVEGVAVDVSDPAPVEGEGDGAVEGAAEVDGALLPERLATAGLEEELGSPVRTDGEDVPLHPVHGDVGGDERPEMIVEEEFEEHVGRSSGVDVLDVGKIGVDDAVALERLAQRLPRLEEPRVFEEARRILVLQAVVVEHQIDLARVLRPRRRSHLDPQLHVVELVLNVARREGQDDGQP